MIRTEIVYCNMNYINPDIEIGVQAVGQKSKAAKPPHCSYLYQNWGKNPVLDMAGD